MSHNSLYTCALFSDTWLVMLWWAMWCDDCSTISDGVLTSSRAEASPSNFMSWCPSRSAPPSPSSSSTSTPPSTRSASSSLDLSRDPIWGHCLMRFTSSFTGHQVDPPPTHNTITKQPRSSSVAVQRQLAKIWNNRTFTYFKLKLFTEMGQICLIIHTVFILIWKSIHTRFGS